MMGCPIAKQGAALYIPNQAGRAGPKREERTKMKNSVLLASAIATALAAPLVIGQAQAAGDNEKCFGVAAAGMNDCQTAANSCAGQVSKEASGDAWIYVPKGTCAKINGGSLTPKT